MILIGGGSSPNSVASQFRQAAESVSPNGLAEMFQMGIMQLDRFAQGHIEVDTGRTKNSLYTRVNNDSNRITAMLGTNVRYSPYVRDDGHKKQFLENTRDAEGPRVLEWLGEQVVLSIEGAFE